MLYGHVHNTQDEILVNRFIRETERMLCQGPGDKEPLPIPCQMINCFCMFSDYTPLSLDEWIAVEGRKWNRAVQRDQVFDFMLNCDTLKRNEDVED